MITPVKKNEDNLSHICQSISARWKDVAGFKKEIEDTYALLGYRWEVDPNDQIHYLTALHTLVLESGVEQIIQTGTHAGFSAISMALALRKKGTDGCIVTIDPEPYNYGGEVVNNPVQIARAVAQLSGLDRYIRFIRGYSLQPWDEGRMDLPDAPINILNKLAEKPFADFMLVDGDHTFKGTYYDMVAGAKALKPDGSRLMFVHDYMSIEDVQNAIHTWRDKNQHRIDFRAYKQQNGYALMQLTA